MASRSLLSIFRPRCARGHRRFDGKGKTGDHERHAIARGGQTLVHQAKQVTESKAVGRLRMDALADFVADEREIAGAATDELRQRRALIEDHLIGVAAKETIGDPERDAIDEDRVGAAVEPGQRTDEIVRFFDRNRRPSAVSGWTPSPTSLLTNVRSQELPPMNFASAAP